MTEPELNAIIASADRIVATLGRAYWSTRVKSKENKLNFSANRVLKGKADGFKDAMKIVNRFIAELHALRDTLEK